MHIYRFPSDTSKELLQDELISLARITGPIMRPTQPKGNIMSENTTSNVTTLPEKKSFFTKTNALRVGAAALAVATVAVVVYVKMKSGSASEFVETLVETPQA